MSATKCLMARCRFTATWTTPSGDRSCGRHKADGSVQDAPTSVSRDGYCACGCGQQPARVDRNIIRKGILLTPAGQRMAYVTGHHTRHKGPHPTERRISYLLSRVIRDETTGCWNWTGGKGERYGIAEVGSTKHNVHRAYWLLAVGPIEDGLVLDHLCRNRLCINPDHLEPVTQRENVIRGIRSRELESR